MNQVKVPKEVSAKVLTIGNQYRNHRGGIGGVIETYSKYFEKFHFIPSYKPQKVKLLIVPYYLVACIRMSILLLFSRGIRIVHIHGAAKGSIFRKAGLFFVAKYIFRRQVIYHSHGSELKLFYEKSGKGIKKLMKFFFENVDEIICLSRQWEAFFVSNFRVKQISVLENIVEKSNISRVNFVETKQPLVFLFLGAIGKRKGIFDLLEVLSENKNKLMDKMVLLIGGNGEEKKLTDYIQENELSSWVKFVGWVNGEKKKSLLLQSNVYILPSYNEGLPLSILEAMSFQLAIISTPIGGIPEVVKEGINGYLVNPGDKAALFQSITNVLQNPEQVSTFGEGSMKLVEPYYAENVIPKLTSVYERHLN
ncbi:MAG: glycosyltransferase family 4 protein [Agriterribacter sp.]